jgi:hypothetical protein
MKQILMLSFATCLFLVTAGCSRVDETSAANICSAEWYALVQKQVLTGDSQGHGPDAGSAEWRSVVEFKLGIRGDKNIPPVDSEQWCEYINSNYME